VRPSCGDEAGRSDGATQMRRARCDEAGTFQSLAASAFCLATSPIMFENITAFTCREESTLLYSLSYKP
jgi:hypothetical protein